MLLQKYLNLKCYPLCLLYFGIALFLAYCQQEYSVIPQLTNQIADSGVEEMAAIESFMRLRWVLILMPAVSVAVRMAIISLCLYVGSFLFFTGDDTNTYYKWWNISVKSQMIMTVYGIIVSSLNLFLSAESALNFPKVTSLYVLFGDYLAEQWMQIPFLAINLFEILLWIFMALLVSEDMNISFRRSVKFVLSSYVLPYIVYMCFLMFITIYIS